MNTSDIKTGYLWIVTGVFFAIYFFYFFIFNRYHIIYQEQIQLFRFDVTYFKDFLTRPGGLMEYAGAFLIQFSLFPFIGSLLLTLAGVATYSITVYIFCKHQVNGLLFSFVPIILLAALHSYYPYTIAYTLGLITSLGYFTAYISVKNSKLHYFLVFCWPLLYFMTGGYALLANFLCFIHLLFFGRNRYRFLIAALMILLALSVPYIAANLIFYIQTSNAWTFFLPLSVEEPIKYLILILLIYYPLVLIISRLWLINSKSDLLSTGWSWKTILPGTLIIAGLAGCIIKFVYDRKTELLLRMDYCIQNNNWDEVLKLSSNYPGTNRLVMYFTNLALYKVGYMGDKLFHYPQSGTNGLWLTWKRDNVSPFFGGEIYYQFAYNSESYRWAFEAMVANGPNPRSLKRLIVTSLINGDKALAEKYLKVVNQTLFYHKWAQHYLHYLNHPELIEKDKEISEKRHFEITSDFISSDNIGVILQLLLAEHFDNKIVFEYYMASLLLEKKLEIFAENVYRLKELGYTSIPIHYEEALLVYMSYTNKNIVPEGYTISMSTRNRLSAFVEMINSFGNNTNIAARSMDSKFGNTYWYYLKFINIQPQ